MLRGLGIAIGLLAVQMLLNRWIKSSLHASFALFVVGMLAGQSVVTVAIAVCLAIAIGWARVILGRHSLPEVMLGSALATIAAPLLWI